jgi:pimeloyl-ACP methyl ester carboxylesterase
MDLSDADKILARLERLPNLAIAPRSAVLQEREWTYPEHTLPRWHLPGGNPMQILFMTGINATVQDITSGALTTAQALLEMKEKDRPAFTCFNWGGHDPETGMQPDKIRLGQMLDDGRAMVKSIAGPVLIVCVSMGGHVALKLAEFEREERNAMAAKPDAKLSTQGRKILAISGINIAWNPTDLPNWPQASEYVFNNIQRDLNHGRAFPNGAQVLQDFRDEAVHHRLNLVESPFSGRKVISLGCPVYATHAADDGLVSAARAHELAYLIETPPRRSPSAVKVKIIDGEHTPDVQKVPDIAASIVDWVKENLREDRFWLTRSHIQRNVRPAARQAGLSLIQSTMQTAKQLVQSKSVRTVGTAIGFLFTLASQQIAARMPSREEFTDTLINGPSSFRSRPDTPEAKVEARQLPTDDRCKIG